MIRHTILGATHAGFDVVWGGGADRDTTLDVEALIHVPDALCRRIKRQRHRQTIFRESAGKPPVLVKHNQADGSMPCCKGKHRCSPTCTIASPCSPAFLLT